MAQKLHTASYDGAPGTGSGVAYISTGRQRTGPQADSSAAAAALRRPARYTRGAFLGSDDVPRLVIR